MERRELISMLMGILPLKLNKKFNKEIPLEEEVPGQKKFLVEVGFVNTNDGYVPSKKFFLVTASSYQEATTKFNTAYGTLSIPSWMYRVSHKIEELTDFMEVL